MKLIHFQFSVCFVHEWEETTEFTETKLKWNWQCAPIIFIYCEYNSRSEAQCSTFTDFHIDYKPVTQIIPNFGRVWLFTNPPVTSGSETQPWSSSGRLSTDFSTECPDNSEVVQVIRKQAVILKETVMMWLSTALGKAAQTEADTYATLICIYNVIIAQTLTSFIFKGLPCYMRRLIIYSEGILETSHSHS